MCDIEHLFTYNTQPANVHLCFERWFVIGLLYWELLPANVLREHITQPGEKLHVLGRSLIRGLHLWQGASRLIGRHLPFRPKMHLARFWISVLEKRSSAQQPTVYMCVYQQLFLLSLCQRSRKCALVRDDAFSGWNFTSPLVADAKAFCLRCVFGFGCGLWARRFVCERRRHPFVCWRKKCQTTQFPPIIHMCVHCAAVDILGNKTQPGSEICVHALGLFCFSLSSENAQLMRTICVRLYWHHIYCKVAFHQKCFFNTIDCRIYFNFQHTV